jgi:hypothetical protein
MKGILMSNEMVWAYQLYNKTHTRRTKGLNEINENPDNYIFEGFVHEKNGVYAQMTIKGADPKSYKLVKVPYGFVHEYLYFKETYTLSGQGNNGTLIIYRASEQEKDCPLKWKSSMFMPKEYARFIPIIKSVKVERLLDISEEDAIAEGVEKTKTGYKNYYPEKYKNPLQAFLSNISSAVFSYFTLWDKLNGIDSHKQNPWVWVYELESYSDFIKRNK